MKHSQVGTLGIIGVVVLFTAACGGSPTKPAALNPGSGDGASAASVTFSNTKLIEAVDEPAAADAPADEVVTSDSSVMDDLWSVTRLQR